MRVYDYGDGKIKHLVMSASMSRAVKQFMEDAKRTRVAMWLK